MKLKRDVLRIAMDTARARGRDYAYVPLADLTALLEESEALERLREGLQDFINYAWGFYNGCETEYTTSDQEREEMQAEWDAHVLALLEPTQPDKGDAP